MTKRKLNNLREGIENLPPNPVVLVTVADNIMTAAAFHSYSKNPPCLMVGILPEQFTLELIRREKEFGINIPTADQIETCLTCGTVSGRDADKYEKTKLTPGSSDTISSSLIEECPLNYECTLVHEVDFPGNLQWIIGEVKAVHIDDSYKRDRALLYWGREFYNVGTLIDKW